MLGLFKKKQPTAMDGVIRAIYGDHPPAKSADLERAVTIAHEDLLCEVVPISEVQRVASGLFSGPMPYSTHDLSVATALSFFKDPALVEHLKGEVQVGARLRVLNWMKAGKVARGVLKIFEDTLYRVYKPTAEVADEPEAEESKGALKGLVDGIRFTEAASQWSTTWGRINDIKAACKAAGIEAEHTRALRAIIDVTTSIIDLQIVRDYSAMLEQEKKLAVASNRVFEAMGQLADAAHAHRVDVSAASPVLSSLAAILKTRGMLKD